MLIPNIIGNRTHPHEEGTVSPGMEKFQPRDELGLPPDFFYFYLGDNYTILLANLL